MQLTEFSCRYLAATAADEGGGGGGRPVNEGRWYGCSVVDRLLTDKSSSSTFGR